VQRIRELVFVLACVGLWPVGAEAEWQIKPFVGLTFAGSTTFLDLEQASGNRHGAIGVSGTKLGNVIGVEGEFAFVPGFFQRSDIAAPLVLRSSVTTLTGNVVITLPRRMTEYALRPYFVGGAGLMHVRADDSLQVLPIASNLAAVDLGGGVTGFLSNRLGLNWDIRYFRSVHGKDEGLGISTGPEQLSFWRASMALAIRY
jgi:hypothetical protein